MATVALHSTSAQIIRSTSDIFAALRHGTYVFSKVKENQLRKEGHLVDWAAQFSALKVNTIRLFTSSLADCSSKAMTPTALLA